MGIGGWMRYTIMIAILAVMLVEMVALMNGINGQLMRFCIVVIAGLAGWAIPFPKKILGEQK